MKNSDNKVTIEITPEMLRIGAEILSGFAEPGEPIESLERTVEEIFEAMIEEYNKAQST